MVVSNQWGDRIQNFELIGLSGNFHLRWQTHVLLFYLEEDVNSNRSKLISAGENIFITVSKLDVRSVFQISDYVINS